MSHTSRKRVERRTVRLTLTLADGTVFTETVDRMPRFWKSWLMQRVPYGTDFYACRFTLERLS